MGKKGISSFILKFVSSQYRQVVVRRLIDDHNPITPVQSTYAITKHIIFFRLDNTLKITPVYNHIRFDIV